MSARLGLGNGLISAVIQLTSTAIPIIFLAGTNATPFGVGALTMLGALPYLLFGFFSGTCLDAYGAGRTILIASGFLMLVLLSVAAASQYGGHHFSLLAIVAFAIGTAGAFIVPAFSTLVARGFSLSARPRAVLLSFRGKTFGDLLGVGAAGVVVMMWGTNAFVLAGVLVPVLIVVLWPLLAKQSQGVSSTAGVSMFRNIRDGFTCLAATPQLQRLFAISVCLNLGQSMIVPMLYPFLGQALALPASLVSLMFALPSVGMLTGTLFFSAIRRALAPQAVIVCSLAGMSAIWILIGVFQPTSYVLVGVLFFLFGFFIAVMVTLLEVIRMGIVPTDLQGRMAAFGMLASRALIPIGALLGGWVATGWSLWAPFLVGGNIMLFSTLLFAAVAFRGGFAPQVEAKVATT